MHFSVIHCRRLTSMFAAPECNIKKYDNAQRSFEKQTKSDQYIPNMPKLVIEWTNVTMEVHHVFSEAPH